MVVDCSTFISYSAKVCLIAHEYDFCLKGHDKNFCSKADSEPNAAITESGPLLLTIIFMTGFIRSAPVKHNPASECIRTLVTTYGLKILQLYE